ncbi:MAG: efflux RND transporter permease subunit [Deltaproteobacteria bacterium]|nr:MAG: efflux RND transporter permease subunit [Deltaproteobacteria bacterium]
MENQPNPSQPLTSLGRWIPAFALARPVTVWMIALALTTLGVLSYQRIAHQLYPSGFQLPFLYVHIPYHRATPKEVEDKIVRPGERVMASLKGLRRLRTWARGNNGGFLLRFDGTTPMTTVYQQLRDRLERLLPQLPEEARRYFIWKWDPQSAPILYFGIRMQKNTLDAYRILHYHLFSAIRQINGVSKLSIWGIDWAYIRIEVNRRKAQSYRLNNYKLIRQLQRDNLIYPCGQLRGNQKVFYVRTFNRIRTLEDLRNYPIAKDVKLRDVARVKFVTSTAHHLLRIDGKPGIFVRVFKGAEANTVEVTRKIRKLLQTAFQKDPALKTFKLRHFTDQGQTIEKSLEQLQGSLLWGGVFALLFLGLFLRHFRMTLLVMTAIPLSLLITIATLYFLGESLNLFSLMGLMLSVGMVVDNAIVVVENIARLRQQGMSPNEAALNGTSEVTLAVLMATATTIVVFLPLVLMSGDRSFRFHMSKVSTPVFIALVASLGLALLVTPLGAAKLLGTHPGKPWPFFDRITQVYRRCLRWFLSHRFDVLLLSTALFLTYQYPKKRLPYTDHGAARLSQFRLNFHFSKNYSIAAKLAYMKKVEKLVDGYKEKWGIRAYTTYLARHAWANVHIYLNPIAQKHAITRRDIQLTLAPKLPEAPGVTRRIGWQSIDGGGGARISIFLYGPDSYQLTHLGKQLEKHLQQDPVFAKIETNNQEDSQPEVQLQLNRKWAFKYRMSAALVGGNVAYALQGRRLRNLKYHQHRYMVRLEYQQDKNQSLHGLRQLGISSWANPTMIPLQNLTQSQFSYGPTAIQRLNRKTFLQLNINTVHKDLARLYIRLNEVMERFPMPKGYSWSKGFRYFQKRKNENAQRFAMLLSIVFVFLLMGMLFESFALPMSVLFSIPFAFVGVYWMLWATGTSFDMMASIGLVMLIGIVVNHAIVLIDRINQLREEGMERSEAVLEACSQRFRPILMTTLTTIGGLLPMAWGGTTFIGLPYAPLGRTVIGGLTSSVILSLLVVPILYTLIDDLRHHIVQRFRRKPDPTP